MPAAARVSDLVKQDAPHCHAPIHPPPKPQPHNPIPLAIVKGSPTVMIDNLPAARVSDTTAPCVLPTCVPAGPGMIAKGSATVMIDNLPAARSGDLSAHPTCIAPIPSPKGSIQAPCSPTVDIGS